MSKTSASVPRLKLGDRIRFVFGDAEIEAIVIEDRGNLGVGGRQIVRIRTEIEPGITEEWETPAEGVDLVEG